jgi:hypothetical protein
MLCVFEFLGRGFELKKRQMKKQLMLLTPKFLTSGKMNKSKTLEGEGALAVRNPNIF